MGSKKNKKKDDFINSLHDISNGVQNEVKNNNLDLSVGPSDTGKGSLNTKNSIPPSNKKMPVNSKGFNKGKK